MTATEVSTVVGCAPGSVYLAAKRGELEVKQGKHGIEISANAVREWHKVLIDRGLAHCRKAEDVELLLNALEGGG